MAKSLADTFDCNDLGKFAEIVGVVRAFGGNSQSMFFECGFKGKKFLTKLYFHRKTTIDVYRPEVAHNSQPPAEVEIKIMKLFKEQIIDKNLTPCIVELLYSKTCDKLKFKKITESTKLVADMIIKQITNHEDLVDNGLADPKYSFIVMEICDITLFDYLKKWTYSAINFAILKSIIFHIIYTMHIIVQIFPSFKHHDFHTMNIMIWVDKKYEYLANRPQFIQYPGYAIPYFGIIPKIIDFGHSEIPDNNIHSSQLLDKDFLFFHRGTDIFNFLHGIGSVLNDEHIDDLLNKINPSISFLNYHSIDSKAVVPPLSEMLKSIAFNEYSRKIPAEWIYHEYSDIPSRINTKNIKSAK